MQRHIKMIPRFNPIPIILLTILLFTRIGREIGLSEFVSSNL